jgi:hypothetical protein
VGGVEERQEGFDGLLGRRLLDPVDQRQDVGALAGPPRLDQQDQRKVLPPPIAEGKV